MLLRLAVTGLVVAIGLASAARADVAKGLEHVRSGDYEAARSTFRQAADESDPRAAYHLGALHHAGLGGPKDLERAVTLYRRASDAGVPEAQFALGALYYKGKGVPEDLGMALELFRAAADAGVVAAQYNLAMMHAAGLAHAADYGAQEDKPRAYKWFTVVLQQLEDPSERATVQESLDFLSEHMTAQEVAEGEEMAREWLDARGRTETSQ